MFKRKPIELIENPLGDTTDALLTKRHQNSDNNVPLTSVTSTSKGQPLPVPTSQTFSGGLSNVGSSGDSRKKRIHQSQSQNSIGQVPEKGKHFLRSQFADAKLISRHAKNIFSPCP